MKQTKIAFTYYWTLDERDEDMCIIRIYCLDKNNKTIVLIIDNFTPYIYLELPTQNLNGNINWTTSKAQNLIDQINENVGYCKPLKSNIIYKKKLYYCNYDYSAKKEKVFPYLLLTFQSKKHMKSFKYIAERQYYVPGFGKVRGKVHEMDASPILQFVCHRKITTAGWIKFKGKLVHSDSMITLCDEEYKVNWKDVVYEGGDILPKPLILSMDIEVNSTNPNRMPRPEVPGDKVFQISCILNREGSKDYRKYILTLGDPDQKITGEDVKIIKFKTESDLLMGYSKFVREHHPNIVTGYNILGFDIEYMIERAKFNLILSQFDICGFPKYLHAEQKNIKWSSSAYGNQEFQFLDGEGILHVDLLPLVKRDFKLDNYKLKTVSEYFIGETKDPLTAKDIFQCYRMGMKNDKDGKKALGCVSKYCVQDSILVTKLFDILQIWVGLSEMAKVCNVPIFYLYTQGQQIKVYSQVYKKCMYENRVVEKDGYIPGENEKYQGAYVFQPEPGLYDIVVPFDFSSLYPTTIIAYNIDYSTLVPEDSDIPDNKCHVIEWTQCHGCVHDKTVRKTKIKESDIVCNVHHRYRFVKHPQGVVPNLLQNLLEARKKTKKEMKDKKAELKKLTSKDTTKKYELEQIINILDKRQLAFKVSCNSVYGAMGVKRGYLPFMPGAMCTTAQGRASLINASENLQATHNAHLVYGDTDSNYVQFKGITNATELWDHCLSVENEISKLFPPPMFMAFEEVIYWQFLILTKKRYMYKSCGRDGIVNQKIGKKGVLLARRDNSLFIRNIYEETVEMIFQKIKWEDILYILLQRFNELCCGKFEMKNFVVSKSVGDVNDYKIRELTDDPKKRAKRLKELNCTEAEYKTKALPAHVQLAEKMRKRGQRVDAGSRLEYLVTTNNGIKAKLFDKLENPDYFKEHNSVLNIEYLYYLNLLSNSLDQILNIVYKKDKFTLNQYKLRVKKQSICKQIEEMFAPKIIFDNEIDIEIILE